MILKHLNLAGTSSKSSIRTIYNAQIWKENDRIIIELTGNGFLYNMVRIISGTLVDVGLGKIKPEEITNIMKKGGRRFSRENITTTGLIFSKGGI